MLYHSPMDPHVAQLQTHTAHMWDDDFYEDHAFMGPLLPHSL